MRQKNNYIRRAVVSQLKVNPDFDYVYEEVGHTLFI